MTRTIRQLRRLLGPLDPAKSGSPRVTDAERDADLARVLVSADPSPPQSGIEPTGDAVRPGRRRRSVLVTAAAVVTLVAGGIAWNVVGSSTPPAFAATPPPLTITPRTEGRPARVMLEHIAQRAEQSRIPVGADGQTEYLQRAWWGLSSQVSGGHTISATEVSAIAVEIRPDGSGRSVTRRAPTEFQRAADRHAWVSDTGVGVRVEDWGPGVLRYNWPRRPPTDVSMLRTLLPGKGDRMRPVAYLDGLGDLLRERVLLPAERAAVLRVLAGLDGVRYAGETTDRAGRPGQAFSLDSNGHGLPARYTIVIDPVTGLILAQEEMLTTDPGKLNVRIPAVISYNTYLTAEFRTP